MQHKGSCRIGKCEIKTTRASHHQSVNGFDCMVSSSYTGVFFGEINLPFESETALPPDGFRCVRRHIT